jgi:asparagine synthase (glutamine-hydrolysing)
MAVSLESRVPFLDHRVVEFAWRVPLGLKIRNRQGKWILRQLLRRHVPRELTDRPKMGFTVPVGEWLRGPLREWAEDMLDEAALRRDGFFQPARVRELLREHLDGRQDRERQLWNLLMFQAWKNDVTRSSRQEEFSHA